MYFGLQVSQTDMRKYNNKNLLESKMREALCDEFFFDCPHTGSKSLFPKAIHTPYNLCNDILNQLPDLNGKSILVWFNPEFYYTIRKRYKEARVYLITGSANARKVFDGLNFLKVYYFNPFDFDAINKGLRRAIMKFDCVIGNPPYQMKVGKRKTEPLWQKFVEKSFELVKDDGIVSLIHPSGWRNIKGRFGGVKEIICSKNLKYLEIHNENDGLNTFGAETRYDWYVCQNSNKRQDTIVKFQNGEVGRVNCRELPMIPNKSLELFQSLLAKEGEERCEVIYSRSAYGTDKSHTNKEKVGEFQYPCIYTVNSKSEPSFFYSNTNSNGHFGQPKVIWSNGRISSIGNLIDSDGEYGLTQFSYAIVDSQENLDNIKLALDSVKYKNLMEDLAVGMLTVNYKILSLFRKDFWREFV